ncbi:MULTISPECIES: flagellar motor switch protein FliN [Hyphobacterium]|uniref:Flagellar motor switch protein FliN n=1 Tax=Hyphobacterium vulgare TaxID=1736751 RepID=A0ABV6ZZV4_9PROT
MADDKDLDLPEFSGDAADRNAPVPAHHSSGHAETLADENEKTAVDLEPVFDVPVNVSAVLGKVQLDVHSLLKLKAGSVVELDRKVGEAIDIYVNNRLVARGEVVVVDERLGVTMTEIIKDGDSN